MNEIKNLNPLFTDSTLSEMSYIYSDLKRSARIVLEYCYGHTYHGLLKHYKDSYIDDRGNPQDFWALMCVAHPELASEEVKVNKSKLKKAIDLIFKYANQIQAFEQLCKDDKKFEESAWFLSY